MERLVIERGTRLYLDTATIIYSVEAISSYPTILPSLWEKIEAGEVIALTSELTLLEVLVLPLRNQDEALIKLYERLLFQTKVRLVAITETILRQAAALRSTTSIKTPDAIHFATAQQSACNFFLTNDRDLARLSSLNVVLLSRISQLL